MDTPPCRCKEAVRVCAFCSTLDFSACNWANWAVGAAKLVAQARQLVLDHFGLLPRLRKQRAQFLIVAVQGDGPILDLLVLMGQGILPLLVGGHLALEDHGIVGAAGHRKEHASQ